MSAEENKALVRRWFEGSTREERFEVSEQERGREEAERARAHLARAESELEAAQSFVEPRAVGRPNSRWPGHSPTQGRASPTRWKRSVRRWASKTPGTTMDRSPSGSRFYSPKLVEG